VNTPWAQCYETFSIRNTLECLHLASLSSRHIIAGKVGAYPSEAALRCFTIDTLGWKVLPSTNYLAYYKNS